LLPSLQQIVIFYFEEFKETSWRGFIKAEEIARLNAILSKARRFGYLPTDFHPLDDLLVASDESLYVHPI